MKSKGFYEMFTNEHTAKGLTFILTGQVSELSDVKKHENVTLPYTLQIFPKELSLGECVLCFLIDR